MHPLEAQWYPRSTVSPSDPDTVSVRHTPCSVAPYLDIDVQSSTSISKGVWVGQLIDALPSPEDVERLCGADLHPAILPHDVMTTPYHVLESHGVGSHSELLSRPTADTHPLIVARYMLLLATHIQHLSPTQRSLLGVHAPLTLTQERLFKAATQLVSSDDDLAESIEGLECIIMESVYHCAQGTLRRSWMACKRALGICQLMGLHRKQPQQFRQLQKGRTHYPGTIYFRLVHLDRILSVILGVPHATNDDGHAAFDAMSPVERLERQDCVIASRIVERNEAHMTPEEHFETTMSIDRDLQAANKTVSSKWWLASPSSLHPTSSSQTKFWAVRALFVQMVHFNLTSHLHLPYLLREVAGDRHGYSRSVCINAAREIVTRFTTLHSLYGTAYVCRLIVIMAVMASITLLIAHLNSHSWGLRPHLAHQFHTDYAMVEQLYENCRELCKAHDDAVGAKSADLLGSLLKAAATHAGEQAELANVNFNRDAESNDSSHMRVYIPSFGIVQIDRRGVSRADALEQEPFEQDRTTANPAQVSRQAFDFDGMNEYNITPEPLSDVDGAGIGGQALLWESNWSFGGIDSAYLSLLMEPNVMEESTPG